MLGLALGLLRLLSLTLGFAVGALGALHVLLCHKITSGAVYPTPGNLIQLCQIIF